MSRQQVILIDNGGCEIIHCKEKPSETIVKVTPADYVAGRAGVWGGAEKGGKGPYINFCMGELSVQILANAMFNTDTYVRLNLIDAVNSIIAEYRNDNDSWNMERMASQFEAYAARMRKAAKVKHRAKV